MIDLNHFARGLFLPHADVCQLCSDAPATCPGKICDRCFREEHGEPVGSDE